MLSTGLHFASESTGRLHDPLSAGHFLRAVDDLTTAGLLTRSAAASTPSMLK
jgi:hypothetical protein